MDEPALLTDEEVAFIQQLYNQPESEQPETLPDQVDLVESINDLISGYSNLENITVDVRVVNQQGHVQSIIPVYTEFGQLGCELGTQPSTALHSKAQERVKQLEAEVAQLKIRLTDAVT
ncbi:hypothetical protein [Pseudomonas sp. S9]|uniref:hypothetical protein n=1 Tax=Pseudomonas sp. S9 TaxID=686578 RepID=UPI0002557587|nr:hypothetical protein [Pseudomonas sp. S9]